MTPYELMIKTNHYLIKNGDLTTSQKHNIVCQLLSARSTLEQKERFYCSVKFPGNTDSNGRHMYPAFLFHRTTRERSIKQFSIKRQKHIYFPQICMSLKY